MAETPNTIPQLQSGKCQWCGLIHTTKCSLIKAIEYYPDGSIQKIHFLTALDLQGPPENSGMWGNIPTPIPTPVPTSTNLFSRPPLYVANLNLPSQPPQPIQPQLLPPEEPLELTEVVTDEQPQQLPVPVPVLELQPAATPIADWHEDDEPEVVEMPLPNIPILPPEVSEAVKEAELELFLRETEKLREKVATEADLDRLPRNPWHDKESSTPAPAPASTPGFTSGSNFDSGTTREERAA